MKLPEEMTDKELAEWLPASAVITGIPEAAKRLREGITIPFCKTCEHFTPLYADEGVCEHFKETRPKNWTCAEHQDIRERRK